MSEPNTEEAQVQASTPAPTQPDPYAGMSVRDRIRAKAANPVATPRQMTLMGEPVVIREPKLDTVLNMKPSEDGRQTIVQLMINYVYTPEGEPVFEEGDEDMILSLPFSQEVRDLTNTIQEMMGVQATADTKSEDEA